MWRILWFGWVACCVLFWDFFYKRRCMMMRRSPVMHVKGDASHYNWAHQACAGWYPRARSWPRSLEGHNNITQVPPTVNVSFPCKRAVNKIHAHTVEHDGLQVHLRNVLRELEGFNGQQGGAVFHYHRVPLSGGVSEGLPGRWPSKNT